MSDQVLLVSGSLRDGSTNTALLRAVRLVAPPGVTAVPYQGLARLPHFSPDDDRPPLHPEVAALRAAVTGAADAHESLRKVLRYAHADVADGTISEPAIRGGIVKVLAALLALQTTVLYAARISVGRSR